MSETAVTERTAIISEAGIGTYDLNVPVLWFTVSLTEARKALIVLSWDEAYGILSRVRDIRDLDGKPCVVADDGYRVVFLRLWKG